MIPTKTLKFWGFKEHPFADNILRDDLLKLFINRETELSNVEDALGHSRVVGVHGTLGVGKSSFLQKLKAVPKRKDGYSTSVDRRLRTIAEKLRLGFEEVRAPSGTTTMNVLRLPKLPRGW